MKTIRKFLTWCKSHPNLAMFIFILSTLILMGLIFMISGWLMGMRKGSTFYHLAFFGYWCAFIAVLAIKANSSLIGFLKGK
jgi:hypothetical protein